MYRVTLTNGTKETIIHSENTSKLKVTNDTLVQGVDGIDSYVFSVNMLNPGYSSISPLKTLITIEDMRKREIIYNGFVKRYSSTMDSEGLYKRHITTWDGLGLLKQTKQLFGEYHDMTPKQFLQVMIDEHNRQTDSWKQFVLGEVDVTNSTDNVYRFLDETENTYDSIIEKLVSRLGGELRARLVGNQWVLDWKKKIGRTCSTEIRVGKNLRDAERDLGTDNVTTRFFIYGADFEKGVIKSFDKDEAVVKFKETERNIKKNILPTNAGVGSYILYRDDKILLGNANSKPYLTIGSVNGGKDYIDDPVGIASFGKVVGHVKFDDVTVVSNLMNKGINYVNTFNQVTDSNTVTAIDLALIGKDIDSFDVYNYYTLNNPGIAEKNLVRVIEKRMSLSNPQNASLTIGEKFIKASKYQSEMAKTSQTVERVRQSVVNQGNIISGVSASVSTIKKDVVTVNTAIQNINTQIGETDVVGLQQAITDLNSVVDELNITIGNLSLATSLKDGLMSSIDKVKLDGINKVTITKDGLMLKQDKSKIDNITVVNQIDLDQFMADFLALKAIVENTNTTE